MTNRTLALLVMATAVWGAQSVCAQEQRPRAEAAHPAPARPAAARPGVPARPGPGAPARPVVDGRGQVMDGRYNHGGYYPPVGTVARTLPPGYRPYYHGG